MKATTLCYPVRGGKVLLAMKKRGLGIGKWNGPGGKVMENESVEAACRREAFEETGIRITEMEDRGVIRFVFDEKLEWDQECRIYIVTAFDGEPVETVEMKPAWVPIDALPLADMWEDDALWLEGVLRGGSVDATFWFDVDGKLLRHVLRS